MGCRAVNISLTQCVLALVCVTPLLLSGCSSSEVREVNKVAIAHRKSHTDTKSLQIAQKTFGLLSDRKTDYRVGPEDVLTVSIFEWELRGETRTVDVRVEESNVVLLPVLGELVVGGKTLREIKTLLEERLVKDGILREPRVSVSVKEFRSKRVAIVGAVHEPGVYTLRQNVTSLLAVLTLAGGINEDSGQVLYVVRGADALSQEKDGASIGAEREVIAIDLYELLELGRLELNVVLENGDVINVPKAKQFYVVGFVGKPGGFPLTRPITVLEGIALAGGLKERESSPGACRLKRVTPEGEKLIPINLVDISRGKKPNMYLMADDVVDVRQTFAKKMGLEFYDLVRSIFSLGYSIK